jgi:RNA polymerase sigma factor (sigma-70 family)
VTEPPIEDLLRPLAPQVLGTLVRRYGHFDLAEDAVQEALLAAATQWPAEGAPANPLAWLVTVASRRLTDLLRSELARRRREDAIVERTLAADRFAPAADAVAEDADDTLILLFMCCHPSLTQASQIALTLRALGGLSTADVARALLVPEDTITRRLSRAKQTITDSGIGFRLPSKAEREDRLGVVLHVLYLVFNEGYVSTAGSRLQRLDLAAEAIRLARMTHHLLPEAPEVSGLLALMLLTDARRHARSGPSGELVPMEEQDRHLWDHAEIAEGIKLVNETLERGMAGSYVLQAAIAAVHDQSPSAEATDWVRIEQIYEQLATISSSPVVELNRAVAVAMARGAAAGLEMLAKLEGDKRIADDHRLYAVRAHLLEMLDRPDEAREAYEAAASRTGNLVQQRYLRNRAARLSPNGKPAPMNTRRSISKPGAAAFAEGPSHCRPDPGT